MTTGGCRYLDLAYGEVKRAVQFLGEQRGHPIHEVNTTSLGIHFEDTRALVRLVTAALTKAKAKAAASGDEREAIGLCSFSHCGVPDSVARSRSF